MKNKSFILKIILTLIIFLFFSSVYSYFNDGIIYHLLSNDSDYIINYLNSFGYLSWFVFILFVILEVIFAPIPPITLYVIAGSLYGGFYGGIIVLIGNLIGAYIAFIIARLFFKNRVEKNINKKIKEKFDKYFKKYGVLSIIILRINPLTTSDLISYLSGLTNIKSTKFIVATAIGLTPMIFIQTFLGDFFTQKYPFLINLVILFTVIYILLIIFLLFYPKKK